MVVETMQRGATAILSGDVVGPGGPIAWRDELAQIIARHDGRVVDTSGAEFLAEFATATAAVACAIETQALSRRRNARLPADQRVGIRIGVHVGERPASVTSRLRSLAEPGAICISEAVRAQLAAKLGCTFQDLGPQALDRAREPVRAYLVHAAAPAARQLEFRRLVILVLATLVAPGIIGLAWVIYFTSALRTPALADAPPSSIAVRPFDDPSGDADSTRIADGMAGELIESLSRVDTLRVVAGGSAEIAGKSGAGSIVEGSVRRSGDQVGITVRLIRVADASEIWSASYDRKLEDVATVGEEIAREIAAAIRAGVPAKSD